MTHRRTNALRMFVAIYPPPDIVRDLQRELTTCRPAAHRVTPLDQVHLTLLFIGDVLQKDVEATVESIERSARGIGNVTLDPTRLITLPQRGRPRLIAAELDASPNLLELQRRLAARLAHSSRSRSRSAFLPHMTLCRFSHGAHAEPLEHAVDMRSFDVDAISLMRSVLRATGAVHAEHTRFDLR